MSQRDMQKPENLFTNLQAMACEDGAGVGESLKNEVLSLDLPSLKLPPTKRFVFPKISFQSLSFAGVLAAALFAVFWMQNFDSSDHSGIRIKGSSKVWVYVNRNGKTFEWQQKSELLQGDRILAEVMSAERSIAFLSVKDRSHVDLTDREFMMSSAVLLAKGEKKSFTKSIVLTGASEGEKLIVSVCPSPAGESTASVKKEAEVAYNKYEKGDCKSFTYHLRK